MMNRHRREFLADVGKGMLIASVGPALAVDLGLAPTLADEDPKRIRFGDREPLVALLQETRPGKLLRSSVDKIPEQLEKIKATDAATLLRDVDAAIRDKDQGRAGALVHRYGELGHPPRPVFDPLLKYAVSEDGSLHAEKYYQAVTEEFAAARPAFRWRHLVALARVTASEDGSPAPGYADVCRLLKV
jgi:hypothetical protein